MSKEKKAEGASKPRNQVSINLSDEMRKELEEERERRGGDRAGIKLAHVAREILARKLEEDRKKKK